MYFYNLYTYNSSWVKPSHIALHQKYIDDVINNNTSTTTTTNNNYNSSYNNNSNNTSNHENNIFLNAKFYSLRKYCLPNDIEKVLNYQNTQLNSEEITLFEYLKLLSSNKKLISNEKIQLTFEDIDTMSIQDTKNEMKINKSPNTKDINNTIVSPLKNIKLICENKKCNELFLFTFKQQEYFIEKNLENPKYCEKCRDNYAYRKFNSISINKTNNNSINNNNNNSKFNNNSTYSSNNYDNINKRSDNYNAYDNNNDSNSSNWRKK